MFRFDETEQLKSVEGILSIRPEIEGMVNKILDSDFDGIYFIGIGGTWASCMQVEAYMRGKSNIPVYVENAAEFLTTGNKRFTKKSVMILSSVTGSTEEIVNAVKKVKGMGARVFGFVDQPDSILANLCDYNISYPENEQIKFFMLANYLMYKNGEFKEYDDFNEEMEAHLPKVLVDVAKDADRFAEFFAEKKYKYVKKHGEMPHYFIGAGAQFGATYSYAMCYWEEQLWIRTKSIHASEFFHGMLEVIDAETPVILYISEDEQRVLSERVANFLPNICRNYTIIDTKDYELQGISSKFRGSISHLVLLTINKRIITYMEREFCHPLDIRRYYRQLDY